MIWNLKTIEAVSKMRSHYIVSEEQLGRAADPGTFHAQVMDDLYEKLRAAAETWAVDLSREDLVIVRRDGEGMVTFDMEWHPRNRPAEMMGGPYDGTIVASPITYGEVIPAKIEVQVQADDYSAELAVLPDGKHTTIPVTTVTYEVTGWSDLHRQWIYEPRT